MTTVKNLIKYTALAALAVGFVSCGDDDDTDGDGDGTGGTDPIEVTAAFSALSVDGEDYAIQFSNTSTNGATYSWDFNADGTEDSAEESPKYVFAAAGEYAVTLTVTATDNETDAVTNNVTVSEPPVVLPVGTNEVTNGDFNGSGTGASGDSGSQDNWKDNDATGMNSSAFNGSSDGSAYDIDLTNTGAKTPGAKWTSGSSYTGTVSGDTRMAYQDLTLDANTTYVFAYDYSMKVENVAGSAYLHGDVLAGHYALRTEAIAASDAGTTLVSLKGDVILGKGPELFTTIAGEFTTDDTGLVSILIHANVSADSYVDNVKIIKK